MGRARAGTAGEVDLGIFGLGWLYKQREAERQKWGS